MFLVRSERQYTENNNTKNYCMGLVIGFDDTPDSFFVHRIERDESLDNPDFNWTLRDIRNKMGFDIDYTDLDNNTIPTNRTTRLQGNLSVVPYDFESERLDYYNLIVSELKQYSYNMYRNLYFQTMGIDNTWEDSYSESLGKYVTKSRIGSLEFYNKPSTDTVIEVQNKLGITEESVRDEQENRDIQRLSSNLRGEIVSDLHLEEFCDWLFTDCSIKDREKYHKNTSIGYKNKNFPTKNQSIILTSSTTGDKLYDSATNLEEPIIRSKIHKLADKESNNIFHPEIQTNIVLGNHSIMASPARIHPDDNAVNQRDRRALEKLIVPDSGLVICGHDEHKSRIYTFPKGVYEFRFLDGLNTDLFG